MLLYIKVLNSTSSQNSSENQTENYDVCECANVALVDVQKQ